MVNALTHSVDEFLNLISQWVKNRADIFGVALVGSYARNEARINSDIDLVILCHNPNIYSNNSWLKYFGKVKAYKFEDWGKVTSVRVFYEPNIEVEFSLTTVDWATIPVDVGTEIVSDGIKILFNPQGILNRLLNAINEQSSNPSYHS